MKKLLYAIAGLSLVASAYSCSMFEYDNYPGPDAQVTGKLLDVKTGEKIGIETAQTSSFDWSTWSTVTKTDGALVVIEQGWDAEADQDWLVRYDGQYTNNIVFAGTYKFTTKKLPCYEVEENNEFTLKKGKNKMNISLLPFCRIVSPSISYDASSKKIVATFYVELGDPERANNISNVALCGNTQLFVGCNYQNLAKNDGGAKKQNVKPGELITLEIDTTSPSNGDLFKYTQDRYVRIAAMAGGNGFNGNNYYNFSPVYKISADFSTIEEVVWDENEW